MYFTDEGDHTLVEVTHSEGQSALGDEWPERVKRFGKSWDEVLPAFVAFLTKRDEDERV